VLPVLPVLLDEDDPLPAIVVLLESDDPEVAAPEVFPVLPEPG
jgi:hypothetical protein